MPRRSLRAQLAGIVSVKPTSLARDLLGTATNATSEQLSADVDRIIQAYRRAGYRDTRVSVSASPDRAGLEDPAMTAALLAMSNQTDEIDVRYTIDEGRPTLLSTSSSSMPTRTRCSIRSCAAT